jgi:hypothetical protein
MEQMNMCLSVSHEDDATIKSHVSETIDRASILYGENGLTILVELLKERTKLTKARKIRLPASPEEAQRAFEEGMTALQEIYIEALTDRVRQNIAPS